MENIISVIIIQPSILTMFENINQKSSIRLAATSPGPNQKGIFDGCYRPHSRTNEKGYNIDKKLQLCLQLRRKLWVSAIFVRYLSLFHLLQPYFCCEKTKFAKAHNTSLDLMRKSISYMIYLDPTKQTLSSILTTMSFIISWITNVPYETGLRSFS